VTTKNYRPEADQHRAAGETLRRTISRAILPHAYERIVDRLIGMGKKVRPGAPAMARCPSHDDREASLAIYRRPAKVKLVCFAGCHEELDVLPALGLEWPDKYDDPGGWVNRSGWKPDPAIKARQLARRDMTLVERAVDDLLQLPDIGERLCRGIAWQDKIAAARHAAIYWLGRADRFAAEGRHQTALACRNKSAFLLWEAGDGDLDG
jgi:hypothetical protein